MATTRAVQPGASLALLVSACLSSAAAAASFSYKALISKAEINSVRGVIIAACTIIIVGGLVNLGIVLAVAPMGATPYAKDAINIEAIVQVLPNQVTEEDGFDEKEDRIDAIRPRRSLVMY